MVKKDKADEAPIEFYIPGPGKGPKIPVPINQPNWIYKSNLNSKPDFSEWLSIGIILTIAIALGVLLVVTSMDKSPLWIVVAVLGIFSIFLIRSAIIRTINHKQEVVDNENTVSPQKREKKFSKRRKDYK
jgi:hypothetical protein